MDLIVYRERGFKETWYLLIPAGSQESLPTEQVVQIYRSRMRIEQGFRDWKTHLGVRAPEPWCVRGLKLERNPAVRLGRLLLALAVAYICLLLIGSHEWVQANRLRFETLRRSPRHGTRRTLSVLSHRLLARPPCGGLVLAAPDLADRAHEILLTILDALTRGDGPYQDELALEALP